MNKKIKIIGSGYVGLSNGLLLARNNKVNFIDINKDRINMLMSSCPTLEEDYSNQALLKTTATFSHFDDNSKVDLYILALPTNFDNKVNAFDTSILTNEINRIRSIDKNVVIMIKSTVPVGFTDSFKDDKIIFSPEFLREGSSLKDAESPSRIIFGSDMDCDWIVSLFSEAINNNADILTMSPAEAESVKLYSNTYLAMRVAFVNELSTFASSQFLNTEKIIEGVGADPRIGKDYFDPSIGYGGYCLPKDSKQLLSEYKNKEVKNVIIGAIVEANELRIESLLNIAKERNIKKIYIEGVGHKPGVSNQRNSRKVLFASLAKKSGLDIVFIDNPSLKVDGFKVLSTPPAGYINIKNLY